MIFERKEVPIMKKERTYENAIVEVTLYNEKDDTLSTEIFLPISRKEFDSALEKILLPGQPLRDLFYSWQVYGVDSEDGLISFESCGDYNEIYNLIDTVSDINDFRWYECIEFAALSEAYGEPSSLEELEERVSGIDRGIYFFKEGMTLEDLARDMLESGDLRGMDESDIPDIVSGLSESWKETSYGLLYK